MYVGTMDTTTLLEPLAKYTNGDILEMTRDEWISQINYIKVMLKLLFKTPVTSSMSAESVVPVETSAETESAETTAKQLQPKNPRQKLLSRPLLIISSAVTPLPYRHRLKKVLLYRQLKQILPLRITLLILMQISKLLLKALMTHSLLPSVLLKNH